MMIHGRGDGASVGRRRTRRGAALLIVSAAVGLVAALTAGPSAAADGHLLGVMAQVTPETKSIFYSTVDPAGLAFTACRPVPAGTTDRWVDGSFTVLGGKPVTMITFSSDTCTTGYLKRFDGTAPTDESLDYWRVDLR